MIILDRLCAWNVSLADFALEIQRSGNTVMSLPFNARTVHRSTMMLYHMYAVVARL